MADITSWTDRQLNNLEKNYISAGKDAGGPFTLAEVKLEKLRRLPSQLDTLTVARKIVELAKQSEDGLTTYGELWTSINPDQEWKGNAAQQIVANALGRVIAYCVKNQLPILTVLVVQAGKRELSDKAVENICREASSLGVAVGSDPKAFVRDQRKAAINLTQFPD